MRRIGVCFLIVLFVTAFFSVPFTAYCVSSEQASMQLKTEVPKSHFTTVNFHFQGHVFLTGRELRDGEVIESDRFSDEQFLLVPEHGYEIKKVIYAGDDQTNRVEEGVFWIRNVCEDAELDITFGTKEVIPSSGSDDTQRQGTGEKTGDDTFLFAIIAILFALSALGCIFLIRDKIKNQVKDMDRL